MKINKKKKKIIQIQIHSILPAGSDANPEMSNSNQIPTDIPDKGGGGRGYLMKSI